MALIIGTTGNDSLLGTSDSDTIKGFGGNDTLEGGAGNDIILGGAGLDIIRDGAGSDSCYAGLEGAIIYADASDATGYDWFFGAAAEPEATTLLYSAATQQVIIDLTLGTAHGAEIGIDHIVNIDGVFGGAGNDIIRGNDDSINGLAGDAGNDTIFGRGGFDRIDGGDGNDLILGGDGNDWLHGQNGADTIFGGEGDDIINTFMTDFDTAANFIAGGGGNDILRGGAGNDTLRAGSGNDTLLNTDGSDRLEGGSGADIFWLSYLGQSWNGSAPRDVICDFEDGFDKFGLTDGLNLIRTYGHDTAVGIAVYLSTGEVFVIRGMTLAQIDASDFV